MKPSKLKISDRFYQKLENQVCYIAEDKPNVAKKFKRELLLNIKKISDFPYSYRKSPFFEEETIRELIFKGYRIIFEINEAENTIEVFGLHKWENELS